MANDFKIELFSYDVCALSFARIGKFSHNIYQIYETECYKVKSFMEAINYMFYEAVACQTTFFTSIHFKVLTKEIIQSVKSLSDCYDYVIQICDRKDLFDHLSVFERLLSTLSFVIRFCQLVHYENKDIDVLNHAHILWVMYFEKFAEQFYEEGGWKELKRVVSSYYNLCPFINFFIGHDSDLSAVAEASVNYQEFKNSPQFHPCKYVSKQWIKFSINNLESYIIIQIHYGYSINAYGAHLLLEDLKLLCDPSSRVSNGIFMSWKLDEEIQSNVNDNLAIEHNVSEQKDNSGDVNIHEFSKDSTYFENASWSECNLINLKVPVNLLKNGNNLNSFKENNAGKSTNVSSTNHLTDHNNNTIDVETTKTHLETEIKSLPEKVNLNLDKSSENKSVNRQKEEFPTKKQSFESIHRKDDTVGEVNAFGSKEKGLTKKVDVIYLKPINEIANNTDKTTNIGENINHVVGTTKTSPVRQMSVYENNQNTSLKQIPSSNHFKPKTKSENTTQERVEISNDDILVKDNDGFALNDLRRMLLVLGDRQGIEYVISTLPNFKGMQSNVTKHKKRGKKKKKPSVNCDISRVFKKLDYS